MKVVINTDVFFQLWKDREKSLGKTLRVSHAAEIIGLAQDTIRNIRDGKTQRFDAPVIGKLCNLLDIPPGPVPFIVYEPDHSFFEWLLKQEGRDGLVGDFAENIRRKSQEKNSFLPINSSEFEDWQRYLAEITSIPDVEFKAFEEAWQEWSGELNWSSEHNQTRQKEN